MKHILAILAGILCICAGVAAMSSLPVLSPILTLFAALMLVYILETK